MTTNAKRQFAFRIDNGAVQVRQNAPGHSWRDCLPIVTEAFRAGFEQGAFHGAQASSAALCRIFSDACAQAASELVTAMQG